MHFLDIYRHHVKSCHARADAALAAHAKRHWLEMAKFWERRLRQLEHQATFKRPVGEEQADDRALV